MRYFIAALVGLGLIILIIALIFHGGGGPAPKQLKVTDYINDTSGVRLTIDGPVSASQTHYDAQITVTEDEARIQVIQGYENDVVSSKTYPMNPTSYAVFLHSLDKVGYTKGNTSKALADERGYCSSGKRYIFELRDGDNELERFWYTSCNSGTYKGNAALTLSLFEKQIPDYGELVNDVDL